MFGRHLNNNILKNTTISKITQQRTHPPGNSPRTKHTTTTDPENNTLLKTNTYLQQIPFKQLLNTTKHSYAIKPVPKPVPSAPRPIHLTIDTHTVKG